MRTAFWLKKSDSWKARGTVGFLFHLCMALFLAGAYALFFVFGTAVFSSIIWKEPNRIQFMIAILTIAFGCLLSSIFGWIGIIIAIRHRVRIFVKSNLYTVCHGDFTVAKTLGPGRNRTNPGNYIVGVVTATPSLAIWFVAMLIILPTKVNDQNKILPFIILGLLPVLLIGCVGFVALLSTRIMAQSPAECWGAEVPDSEEVTENWYQTSD